jgi:hypothetical protein
MRLNPQIRLQSRPARLPAGFSLKAVSKLQWRAPTRQPLQRSRSTVPAFHGRESDRRTRGPH